MVMICPDLPDGARLGACAAAAALGLDRRTLRRYAAALGLAPSLNRLNGRAVWSGRQVKQIWRASC